MVSHRNVVRLLRNDRHPFDFNAHDTWIMAHSYCFDFSVWEMYGAILYGGKLIVPVWDNVRDVNLFLASLKQHQVTVLNQTPSSFYHLIAAEEKTQSKTLHRHLRYVVFGGEKLEPGNLNPWVRHYPSDQIALINMYGITETTVHVTFYAVSEEDILSSLPNSPIGRSLA